MRHWGPHAQALQAPPSARCQHLRMLHCTHTCIATSRKEEGEPGHSILQHDMPDEEEPDCPEDKQRKLKHAGASFLSCFAHAPVNTEEWEGWFCQFLGEPIPALEKLWREKHASAPAAATSSTHSATTSMPARSTQAAAKLPTRPSSTPSRKSAGRLGSPRSGATSPPSRSATARWGGAT